jgi:hypothetical protein
MIKLDDLRRTFRIGMNKSEFFAACDDLLPLEFSMPGADPNFVGIKVPPCPTALSRFDRRPPIA